MKQKEKEVVVRGMKHSEELGCAIASHWDVKALGEVAEVVRGLSYKPYEKIDNSNKKSIILLRSNNIQNNYINFNNIYHINKQIKDILILNNQDIIICMSNGSKNIIGKIGIFFHPNDNKIYTAGSFCSILRTENKIVYYFMQSSLYKKQLSIFFEGTNIQNLKNNHIQNLKLPLPPVEEQEAIARVLGSADAVLDALAEQHAKAEALKTMLMQQLLSGTRSALDGAPMPMKHSEELGCAIAAHWDVKALGEVCDFTKGKGLSKKDIVQDGQHPCILYGQIFTIYNEIIDKVISKTNIKTSIFSISGDILMADSDVTPNGLAKACCLLENNVLLSNGINIIRPNKKKIYSQYLSYYLNSYQAKKNIFTFIVGTTVKHLYNKDLKTLFIPLPPVEEQEAIARVLGSADAVIDALAEQRATAEALKTMLMQQLLSGTRSALP